MNNWLQDGNAESMSSIHLDSYLNFVLQKEGLRGQSHIETMRQTCDQFLDRRIRNFDNSHSSKILLLGEVQSGKTAQMLALIAATADQSDLFKLFVLLTSSNVALYQQTLFRCMESLPTMAICGESDELRLVANANRRPAVVVLKKNSAVLKRWRNTLLSTRLLEGRPIVVFDDEADATSLNTAINRGDQSAINRYLDQIVETATSSIFVQVTATPQALFLQGNDSGWRPKDSIHFAPGDGYLGGAFFFSDPAPYSYRRTPLGELAVLTRRIRKFADLPRGFKEGVVSYLIASSHQLLARGGATTFLIHPSWTQDSHSRIEGHLNLALDAIAHEFDDPEISALFEREWADLQRSFPELLPLTELAGLIRQNRHTVHVLNSAPENSVLVDFKEGSHIAIGGNSLGRGLTFPMLLTVYYCRESRIPQQDTIWQHCRMFGYDRVAGLSRMFMSGDLFDLFSETHASNEALIKLVRDGGADSVKILTSQRTRATRRAVVDQSLFSQYVGGVNYFPNIPDESKWGSEAIDRAISAVSSTDDDLEIPLQRLINLMKLFESGETGEWSTTSFVSALEMYANHRGASASAHLLIRRNRDVGFGTGTLLSPNDRSLALAVRDRPILVVYRLTGSRDKGWRGSPFWIPNIKLPDGYVFNFVD